MKSIKKLLVISISYIFALFIIASSSFATSTGVVNSETVRLRKETSSKSSIVALMSIGEKVEILSEENDWYKVKYNSKEGYALKELIDVDKTTSTTTNTVNETTNTATTTENTVTEQNVENTTENTVENEVVTENTVTEDTSADVEETSKVVVGYKSKTTNKINLKLVPSINSNNICELTEKTEIEVKEVINNWSYIETILGSGWVRITSLEKNVESEEVATPEETASTTEDQTTSEEKTPTTTEQTETKTKVGYVNVDTVNLRKDKSTSSEILASLSKNTEVTILSEEDNWYKVKVNKTTGYIAVKYVSNSKVAETPTSRGTETERTELNTEETSTATTSTTANSTSTTGSAVVSYAKQYLGYKYVSGGSTPSTGFDCSGFTYYVYKNFGVTLSRASTAQVSNGTDVKKANLQLGDIVVFNNDANTKVGHVGIYIGSNQFIHAANAKKGVIITSLSDSYYSARYVTARRVL